MIDLSEHEKPLRHCSKHDKISADPTYFLHSSSLIVYYWSMSCIPTAMEGANKDKMTLEQKFKESTAKMGR